MNIIFKTGEQFEYIRAYESSTFHDNANRRVLEIQMEPATVALDILNGILANTASTTEIVMTNEVSGDINYYNDYEIKVELSVKNVPFGDDIDGNPKMVEMVVFKLGRLTVLEKKLKALGL